MINRILKRLGIWLNILRKKKDTRRGMVRILVYKDGNFLISQRTGYSSYRGLWQCPGGGIEKGESPRFAAVRELREEVGWSVGEWKLEYLGLSEFNGSRGKADCHTFCYTPPKWSLPANPEPHKCNGWRWVSEAVIETYQFIPGHAEAFGDYLTQREVTRTMSMPPKNLPIIYKREA